jgi:hypothetical protein
MIFIVKLQYKDINATGVEFVVSRSRSLMDTPGGDDTPNLRDSSIEVLAFREKVVELRNSINLDSSRVT